MKLIKKQIEGNYTKQQNECLMKQIKMFTFL